MAQKSLLNNFDKAAIRLEPHIPLPDISDAITQTLSRLLAWDKENELFRLVEITESGGLVVSNYGDKSSNIEMINYVTNIPIQVAYADQKRYSLKLTNTGVSAVAINPAEFVADVNSYSIYPNQTLELDNYLGDLWVSGDGSSYSVQVLRLFRDEDNYFVT